MGGGVVAPLDLNLYTGHSWVTRFASRPLKRHFIHRALLEKGVTGRGNDLTIYFTWKSQIKKRWSLTSTKQIKDRGGCSTMNLAFNSIKETE
jgi:hypothetical protein